MSRSVKAICAVAVFVFTIVMLFGLTVFVIEKTTDYIYFVNETLCTFRITPFLIFFFGAFGDAFTFLIICLTKKSKTVFKVISLAVVVLCLISAVFSLLFKDAVDRYFYYESSPDGKNEIIVSSYQFLIAGGGDVYYRVNPFFVYRLKNEEKKHVEWFYDDYTVEWHEEYIIVDGYTYMLPER